MCGGTTIMYNSFYYSSTWTGCGYVPVQLWFENIFHNAGIKIIYENFQHPTYKQIHGSFIENISILDLLFNEGENSQAILASTKNF